VKLVGTDCISLDPGDGGGGELAAHYTLLPQGVQILENVCNLGALDPISFFMALPLAVASGTGSPVRAVAIVGRTA
jgi:arylformamidase